MTSFFRKRIGLFFISSIVVFFSIGISFLVAKHEGLSSLRVVDIPFYFGKLVANMMNGKGFQNSLYGITFQTHRLPFIPYFLLLIFKVFGENLTTALVIKNILFSPIIIYSIVLLKRVGMNVKDWILYSTLLITPQWLFHSFNFSYEEGYILFILNLLFIIALFKVRLGKSEWIFITILMASVLWIKSATLYLTFLFPFAYFLNHKNVRLLGIQALVLILSLTMLSGLHFKRAGKFTPSSSLSTFTVYHGFHDDFLDYFPKYTPDIMSPRIAAEIEGKDINTEWEFYDFYKRRATDSIFKSIRHSSYLTFIKVRTFFFEIRPWAQYSLEGGLYKNPIHILGSVAMVFHRLVFLLNIGFIVAIFLKKKKHLYRPSVLYLLFFILYCFPFVVGFGYERHYMGLLVPQLCFFALCLRNGSINSQVT
ncbi:hypothetical protein HOG98_00485 [bacterium]|jgi:hypothetical protein|nr:hypothetical protein [bacterium]